MTHNIVEQVKNIRTEGLVFADSLSCTINNNYCGKDSDYHENSPTKRFMDAINCINATKWRINVNPRTYTDSFTGLWGKLSPFANDLRTIVDNLTGWCFAEVRSTDPFLDGYIMAGFQILIAESHSSQEETYRLVRKCGLSEKVSEIDYEGSHCKYNYLNSSAQCFAGITETKDMPEEVIQDVPRLFELFDEVVTLENVEIESPRHFNLARQELVRLFLSQMDYVFRDSLVMLGVEEKDNLSYITAVHAGFVPVCVFDDNVIFAKTTTAA